MVYDPHSTYSGNEFKRLPPAELMELLKEAKIASHQVQGSRLIKKVTKDISNMRRLLNGFDSVYNGGHR